jgi:hypothetical protein
MKSGSLNLLELSGPVQVCNGIALPLTVNITEDIKIYFILQDIFCKLSGIILME